MDISPSDFCYLIIEVLDLDEDEAGVFFSRSTVDFTPERLLMILQDDQAREAILARVKEQTDAS